MQAILRHIGIDLILADNDQACSKVSHRLHDIGATGQHMRDDFMCSQQSSVIHGSAGCAMDTANVNVFGIECSRGFSVSFAHLLKVRFRRRGDGLSPQPMVYREHAEAQASNGSNKRLSRHRYPHSVRLANCQ